jgi:DNA-binding IclR family transcriptional regulator
VLTRRSSSDIQPDGNIQPPGSYALVEEVATLRLGVGSVLPMSTTSIGRAYLWGLPEAERQRLIDEHKRRAGAQGDALEQAIDASFAELDSSGTCAVLGGFQRSTFGVALPLRLGRERTLMSMSCGKADVDFDLQAEHERIAPVLKETAAPLEAELAGCASGL